jgi:hypothetical protein
MALRKIFATSCRMIATVTNQGARWMIIDDASMRTTH